MWSPVITLNMSILVSLLRTVSGFWWEVVDTCFRIFLVQIAIRVVKTAVPVKRVFHLFLTQSSVRYLLQVIFWININHFHSFTLSCNQRL